MQTLPIRNKIIGAAALVALLGLGAIQAQAQSVLYNFSDGTSDGWSTGGFGGGTPPPISNIGGVNYIMLPLGGFQVGNVASGYAGNLPGFNTAMAAAAANPSGYTISYDYYVNTAGFTGSTFLQIGTFVNSGSGYYAQDFGSPNEVSLDGTQLSSGQVFTGHISFTFATAGYAIPPADTFFRLGLVENGSGSGVTVGFSNISVAPVASVPEPGSLALLGFGLTGGVAFLRRRKS